MQLNLLGLAKKLNVRIDDDILRILERICTTGQPEPITSLVGPKSNNNM
jgi:hypothetical protein